MDYWCRDIIILYTSIGSLTSPNHRLNMELNLLSLFGLHVHSCTHWLIHRDSPPPPHLDSYTRALLVSKIDDISLCSRPKSAPGPKGTNTPSPTLLTPSVSWLLTFPFWIRISDSLVTSWDALASTFTLWLLLSQSCVCNGSWVGGWGGGGGGCRTNRKQNNAWYPSLSFWLFFMCHLQISWPFLLPYRSQVLQSPPMKSLNQRRHL